MRRMWTAAEKAQLAKKYAASGACALADEFQRSPDSISSQARRYGITCTTHRHRQAAVRAEHSQTVNTRFFDTTTPATAFVLGYIWGCGSVKTKHRHVLRLTCPREHLLRMRIILALMDSRHQLQTYLNTHVVELCNTHLVKALIERFGSPPGRRADGEPPIIPDRLVSRFAAGHMLATGSQNDYHVRWSGHRTVIQWLAAQITTQVNVPPPEYACDTLRPSIRWCVPKAVHAIRAWMDRLE